MPWKRICDIQNEEKRKIRIAAGGLQSIKRLGNLLIPNPFHLGTLLLSIYISPGIALVRYSCSPFPPAFSEHRIGSSIPQTDLYYSFDITNAILSSSFQRRSATTKKD